MPVPPRDESACDLYQLLAVSPDASSADITRAYRRRALTLHPDSRPQDTGAAARFRAVVEAYQILSDPATRAEYDRHRLGQPPREPIAGETYHPRPARQPPLWQASPAMRHFSPPYPGSASTSARAGQPPLRAGPVHITPPGSQSETARHRRAADLPVDLAGLLSRLLREHPDLPW